MKVVITGGMGFIGQRLARALLARGGLTGPRGGHRKPLEYDYNTVTYGNWLDSVYYARDHRDVSLNGLIDHTPSGWYGLTLGPPIVSTSRPLAASSTKKEFSPSRRAKPRSRA